ncbi:MAG: ligase-associated DNA damage response endonuclease PdeM [Rhodospirillales bacterium]|nr:ligase-associated DNA damage response endonuclease PdeM [Rhodospirillales bacterium]
MNSAAPPLAPIRLAGAQLMLDPAGAVLWPEQGLLAIADLHLEKASAAARRGSLLPPWDSMLTLDRLALLLARHRPRIVIALGDSFHDAGAPARLAPAQAARIAAIAAAHRLIWIAGNHDPAPPPVALGGEAMAEFALAPLVFRHAPVAARQAGTGEVAGHFHPKARIAARGARIARPCFVTDGARLLLPAFGTYTGGLDATDPAIAALFPEGAQAFLLGEGRLFSFALRRAAAPGGKDRRTGG